jgi:hypothetical protein
MTEPTLHAYEASGCGVGPFRLIGVCSIPSPSLAEHNVDAYNNALRALPRDIGVGVCRHCSTPIMHNFICQDATGKRFVVGSECVAKVGGKALGDKAHIEMLRIQREARRVKNEERRAARHAQWLIDNADLVKEREAKAARERAEAEARLQASRDRWAFMLPILDNQSGDFCRGIAESIRAGDAPSGRAIQILGDIYAKACGARRGSKDFEARWAEYETRIGGQ